MRFITCVFTMILCAMASGQYDLIKVNELRKRLDDGVSSDDVFPDFMSVFKKNYLDDKETAVRKKTFHENMQRIIEHNALYAKGESSYTMAVNQFADLSPAEFKQGFSAQPLPPESSAQTLPSGGRLLKRSLNDDIPREKNWASENCVTAVKDQGVFGTCYAFATTGAMECLAKKETGNLVELSEQQLIKCSPNDGCDGGRLDVAFQYIVDAGGLMSSESYPYEPKESDCKFNDSLIVNGTDIAGYIHITHKSKADLLNAVANVGPVAIAIDTEQLGSLQFLNEGFADVEYCEPITVDHAVLLVGYGSAPTYDYWLVRNSWGVAWGLEGYFKIPRYMNDSCTVVAYGYYPVKELPDSLTSAGGSLGGAAALAVVVAGIIMDNR